MAPTLLCVVYCVVTRGVALATTLYHSDVNATPMIPYIDIHTHCRCVHEDVKAVINRNYDEEVVSPCSIGIHPYLSLHALSRPDFIDRSIAKLKDKAWDDGVVAIGEAGLDSLRGADIDTQIRLFRMQAAIAEEVKKPLVIHCVKQFDEIIRLKRQMRPTQTWIMHGYRKNEQMARQLIDQGLELSFGSHYNVQALQYASSTGHLWLETDDSDMDIREHYSNVASLLDITTDELKLTIYNQAVRLSSVFLQE